MASDVSPGLTLSKCATRQDSRPPLPTPVPRPNSTDLPLAWEEGGRLVSGSRGPWSRGVQGSPSSHHSSSLAVLLGPPRAPPHPQPRRASSRDTRLATFRFCVTARPQLRFHEWEVTGESRIYRLGPGGGGPGQGNWGAELSRPQSLVARRLGPDWLAAGGKRDLGQTGRHPLLHQKKKKKIRFWTDSRSSQSGSGVRAGPTSARPLSFALCYEGGAPGKSRASSDGNCEPAVAAAASRSLRASASGPPQVPAGRHSLRSPTAIASAPRCRSSCRLRKASAPVRGYPCISSASFEPLAFQTTGQHPCGAANQLRSRGL